MLGLDPSTLLDDDIKVSEFTSPKKQWDFFFFDKPKKQWDYLKLRNYLPNDLVQLIQGIPIPCTEVMNSFLLGLYRQ